METIKNFLALVSLTKLCIEIYKYIENSPEKIERFIYGKIFKSIVILSAVTFTFCLLSLSVLNTFLLAFQNISATGLLVKLSGFMFLILVAFVAPYAFFKAYQKDFYLYKTTTKL